MDLRLYQSRSSDSEPRRLGEYNVSKIDTKNKRKLYDSKGHIKTIYGYDENNRNHGLTFMMCPYPNNNKIREIIEFDHGIIHGKRIIIEYIHHNSGQVYIYQTWNHGHLIDSLSLPI